MTHPWSLKRLRDEAECSVLDWGRVFIKKREDEMDVRIEFRADSLTARRSALQFAEALVTRVQEQLPGMRADFHAESDHYRVHFRDFGSAELKAAHVLYERLARRYGPGA